jgi:hypothetical protein
VSRRSVARPTKMTIVSYLCGMMYHANGKKLLSSMARLTGDKLMRSGVRGAVVEQEMANVTYLFKEDIQIPTVSL